MLSPGWRLPPTPLLQGATLHSGGEPVYTILAFVGIGATACIWEWYRRRHGVSGDRSLLWIYIAALCGALVGAKIAYLTAEGWSEWGHWEAILSGRSITGGLFGGVLAVEWAKRAAGYRKATGDLFALTVPCAIMIGRVGCVLAGCCRGVACAPHPLCVMDEAGVVRWPAAQVELLFNALFLVWALLATRFGWQRDQRFNLYLISYGLFRYAHEFLRDDVRFLGRIGGYHIWALAIALMGGWMYYQRRQGRGAFDRIPL